MGTNVDYSIFNPFPSQSYYHPYCLISNYDNQTNVVDCWEGDTYVSLPDLDTTQTYVKNTWNAWVKSFVANYSSMILPDRLSPLKICTDHMIQLTDFVSTPQNISRRISSPISKLQLAFTVSEKCLTAIQHLYARIRVL